MPSSTIHTFIRYDGNKFNEYNNFKDKFNFDNIKKYNRTILWNSIN